MGGLKDSPTNWISPNTERGDSSMPDEGGRQTEREKQDQPTRRVDPTSSEPANPVEAAQRQVSMSDLHRIITEALDMLELEYVQNEDRDDVYLIERDGVLLMVGVKGMNGVPVGIVIVAIVLKNVECTKELAVDLLKRNGRATFATWEISDGSDGAVDVSFSYQLSAEQLNVELVARMINWVLNKSTEEIDALQATYGGERAFVVKEEPPPVTIMPTGALTFKGRYPGYDPAQAMAAFFSVSSQRGRPSYQELRDSFWMFDGGGYELAVGCFAEPDGTSVILVTGFSDPEYTNRASELMMGENAALKQSAHSTGMLIKDDELSEAVASGSLRQLRPSEVGPIPDSASEKPAEEPGSSLRFDGLYHAQESSYHSYLRFYEDGTVLQVSTNGKPEQLARWFGKTHTEVPRGTYSIEGQSIEFSTASSEGTVAYKGTVFDDAVEVITSSPTNGQEEQTTYGFVQVALR